MNIKLSGRSWPTSFQIIFLVSCLLNPGFCLGADKTIFSSQPARNQDLISNTNMGWETNNSTLPNSEQSNTPPSSVAYFKYYLKSFLTEEGELTFSELEQDLTKAQVAGQQLSFRLMAYSDEEGAEILKSFGVKKGFNYRYDDGETRSQVRWAPDFDDSSTLAVVEKLLLQLGRKYDSDRRILNIDIGLVGLWGEWHNSDTIPKIPLPKLDTQKHIIDYYFAAFPNKTKLMQIQLPSALQYAISKGAGLRADCLAASHSRMMQLYPRILKEAAAEEAWRSAPLAFEICWTLPEWERRGWDFEQIFNNALTFHPTYINTKSLGIPNKARPAFDRFLSQLGYQIGLNKIQITRLDTQLNNLSVSMHWQNSGSAPCYSDLKAMIRLMQNGQEIARAKGSRNLCHNYPENILETLNLEVDCKNSAPIEVQVGLGSANSNEPQLQLNFGKRDSGNWYVLGFTHIIPKVQ